jgi:hypothetical protein
MSVMKAASLVSGLTHRIRSYLLVCGLLPFAACASEGSATGAADLDAAPRLAYEEILRIGSVDDPDYGFTAINGVDLDNDGNIYVFEGSDAELRVYSPEGELLHRIGRRGEGPGEFRGAPGFGIHGDTIWAVESFGRRIHLFGLDGTVISTAPVQNVTVGLQTGLGIVMPTEMTVDGTLIGELRIYTGSRDMEIAVGRRDTVPTPRVRFAADGTVIDTAGWMPRFPPAESNSEMLTVGSNRYLVPGPPSEEPLLVGIGDGHLFIERSVAMSGERSQLTVTRIGLAGDTVMSLAFAYTPRPFDEAALDEYAWRSARRPGGGVRLVNGVPQPEPVADDSMDVFARVRGAMNFPAFQPPIRAHRMADDGGIWLMREEDGGDTQRWTVLGPEAHLVGEITLPRGVYPIWMDSETFFAIERDDFDVQWLVRYRLHTE